MKKGKERGEGVWLGAVADSDPRPESAFDHPDLINWEEIL
jgi:hypothetical protein